MKHLAITGRVSERRASGRFEGTRNSRHRTGLVTGMVLLQIEFCQVLMERESGDGEPFTPTRRTVPPRLPIARSQFPTRLVERRFHPRSVFTRRRMGRSLPIRPGRISGVENND